MLEDRRLRLLFTVAVALLAVAGLRSVWFAVAQADTLGDRAAAQQVSEMRVPALRGAITDRAGNELAVSEPAYDVAVNPKQVRAPAKLAPLLARALKQGEDEVEAKITKPGTGFVYLARTVPATQVDWLRSQAEKQEIAIDALTFDARNLRRYPRKMIAAQLLGQFGTDDKALSGLEYSEDGELRGRDGLQRDVLAGNGSPLETTTVERVRPGKDVRLTIDGEVQAAAEETLQEVGARYRPKRATAIVMRPRDNAVLAMANWPRVDANDPGDAPPGAQSNTAASFTYEPGSTFKAFTVAGALQDRKVTPDQRFTLPPSIQVADRTIGESHPRGTETMTTGQILAESSNVGAVTIGLKLGARRFDAWSRKFGFGRPTGVGLPDDERGRLLSPDDYSGSSMGNLPIGQGELVTPLQVASGYSAIANGGILRRPRLIDAVGGARQPVAKGTRILSPQVAGSLRQMMTGAFDVGGTASTVSIPGYQLAGKTGTANKFDVEAGEYSEDKLTVSFAGFAPAKDPKLVVAIVVDEPVGGGYGGTIAAPAFGRIARFALPYLRIPPG